ncbi:MAG: VWA domain-containing protein, partial [Anaerolineae bacterium]|nr:VWA domain-containing protein [Anaerolineae bacterium]
MQDSPPVKLELTGANTSDFPTVILTANAYDRLGQPLLGLTRDNFAVTGELADRATIISVENITDNNLAFSAVLAIDTSSSMAGAPFDRAREAAISFVNSIGPNDPVAVVAFDSTERLVQDFTTDKTVLLNAINSLTYGGRTALYDGSLLAVQKAA